MSSALPPDHRRQLGRIRFRRAVALMLMTLVLPGSAQIVAGRKETGRIAMRIWFALLATVMMLFVISLLFDNFVFWFVSASFPLTVTRFVLMGLAIGWAYLFVDAWRIGEPLAPQTPDEVRRVREAEIRRAHRLARKAEILADRKGHPST